MGQLDDRKIMITFVSLLLERRIVFCSSKLSILSSCIQTAVALLYPFTWQHIFIPVLPRSLLSFVCAPMPFVVGVLRTELQEVLSLPMDEVLIIDLDTNTFIRTPSECETDDLNLVPPHLVAKLRKVLKESAKNIKRATKQKPNGELEEKQLQYELRIVKQDLTEKFVQFFASILGKYRNHLRDNHFDTEQYIQAQPSDIVDFLSCFSGSQMFECFINERVQGLTEGGFEKLIDDYERLEQSKIGLETTLELKKAGKRTNIKNGWQTLRNSFKKDTQPVTITPGSIGAPTLVKSSSHRPPSEAFSTPTPVPVTQTTKPLPSIPEFVVPRKSMPKPPGGLTRPSPPPRAPARNGSDPDLLSATPFQPKPNRCVSVQIEPGTIASIGIPPRVPQRPANNRMSMMPMRPAPAPRPSKPPPKPPRTIS